MALASRLGVGEIAIASSLVALLFGCSIASAQTAPKPPSTESRTIPNRFGGIVPMNLENLVAAQKRIGVVAEILLPRSRPTKAVPRPVCSSDFPAFDWRAFGKVTPVQDQGECGSCWVFAAVAAYESSHLIENGLTEPPPGPPPPGKANTSEQEGLDCSSPLYSCDGGWHDKVFDYLVNVGKTTRSNYPYVNAKRQCKVSFVPKAYSAVHWNFVDGANIPRDTAMKAAICEHGPIVAGVRAQRWDLKTADDAYYQYSRQNPDWSKRFPKGVFAGEPSKPDLNMNNLVNGDVDHVVVIVGWDDSARAWLVKNSWGLDWGDAGYMKVAYGTANLGFNAAWIQAQYVQPTLPKALIGPPKAKAVRIDESRDRAPLLEALRTLNGLKRTDH